MMYEFVGQVLQVSERTGTGQRGDWKMWEVVILHASTDQFTRKAVINVWDEAAMNTISFCKGNGQPVRITASIDAREYNGRWFNYIRGFRAEPVYVQPQAAPRQMYSQPGMFAPPAPPQYIPSGTAQPWGQGAPQGPQGQGDGGGGQGNLPF